MPAVTYDTRKGETVARDVQHGLLALARAAARGMVDALKGTYPQVSGALVRGVIARDKRLSNTGALVQTRAHHAHLYELGTRPRFDALHANRSTGAMPRRATFVPAAVRARDGFAREAQAFIDRDREIV